MQACWPVTRVPTRCRTAAWTPAGRARRRWASADSGSQDPCTEGTSLIGPAAGQSRHWRRARTQQVTPEGRTRTWEPPETQRRDRTSVRGFHILTFSWGVMRLNLSLCVLPFTGDGNLKLQASTRWATSENLPRGWGKRCPVCFQKLLHTWWSPQCSSGFGWRKTTSAGKQQFNHSC